MSAIFSLKLPYKIRCNLPDCGKPVHLVFKMQLDGMMNAFCSPAHANLGENRWEEKKRLNIKPGQPITATEEMVGDNIQQIEEEGGM